MPRMPLEEFADRMNQLLPVVIKEFSRRQPGELYKGKISLPQYLIMDFLNRQGEAKMTDIARFMKVSTAAMTGFIDRLINYGYVVRGFDKADRRIIKVRLTAKGLALVKKITSQRRQMFINTFGRLSAEDRENYLRILTQVRDILSENGAGAK